MLNADLIDTIIVAYSLIKKKQILILRASPHPSAGTARLSQHRECLSQSLTNAIDRTSSAPKIGAVTVAISPDATPRR
ncbi:MAG: hypothetical protein MPK75_03670, partial [Alphaproteobacteria bacterium]|nr:hypothetical protein [Alphaproteobacteria bacterium]